MSYEILYKIFTIKKGNNLIPFVIEGSNNCFEQSGKRERNLHLGYSFFKQKMFNLYNNKYKAKALEDDIKY